MMHNKINLIVILCVLLCIPWIYMDECYSNSNNEDRIDSFIREFKLQQLEGDEARESIGNKKLQEVPETNSSGIISISAFDVSEDGKIALAATTGLDSGVINIYDEDMNIEESFSYQYNNGVYFILYEKNRVLFSGYKFHGVYVVDLNSKDITAYKWTNYDYLDEIRESDISRPSKTKNKINYYLSNSRKRKPIFYVDTASFRYLIAEKGEKRMVLLDAGNTLMLFCICVVAFFLGVATISIRRWINEIKRIREGK